MLLACDSCQIDQMQLLIIQINTIPNNTYHTIPYSTDLLVPARLSAARDRCVHEIIGHEEEGLKL